MSPGVPRAENAFDLDSVNTQNLTVLKQCFPVIRFYHGKFVMTEYYLPTYLSCEIPAFDLAHIKPCVLEQQIAVYFHRTDMIGVLMSNENVMDIRWVNIQPLHFFTKPVIIVPGINHDGCPVFRIEEDIGNPFTNAGNTLVNAARIKRFEVFLASVPPTHNLFLKD